MTEIPVTPSAAATILFLRLTAYGWRFGLDADGDLVIMFGDDPPHLSQHQAMAQIERLVEEFKDLVRPPAAASGSSPTSVH